MDLPQLKLQRGAVKGSLTKALTYALAITDASTTTELNLKTRRELVESQFARFESIQAKIEDLTIEEAALNTQIDERKEIEDKYLEIITALDSLISTIQRQQPAQPRSHVPASTHHSFRLPEIQMPIFEGNFEDWLSFEDLFVHTVDKNPSLSGSHKLQYLKSCTKGSASALIKSFTVTDSNYTEAWKLMKERYSNKREIIHSLIKRLLFQQSIKHESITSLQSLLNTTLESIRSLEVLGRPTTHWDDLVTVLIIEKLDPETKAEWAKSLRSTDPPTMKELQQFIEQHIRSLHAKGTNSNRSNQRTFTRGNVSTHHSQTGQTCKFCSESHSLFACPKFKELTPAQRSHGVKDCSSRSSCRTCARRHNTLLHDNTYNKNKYPATQSTQGQSDTKQNEIQVSHGQSTSDTGNHINSHMCSSFQERKQVLLKTALVNIQTDEGQTHQCRILLDDGSEASFISESCAKRLGLRKRKTDVMITGISATISTRAQWETNVWLKSQVCNAHFDINVIILPKVTGNLPKVQCEAAAWSHITGLQLADPSFNEPGEIDILVGADVVPYVMKEGIRQGYGHNTPVAHDTIFGWVLYGRVSQKYHTTIRANVSICHVGDILRKFWELEELPEQNVLTTEEEKCEAHFLKTYSRQPDGRFVVRLPFDEEKRKNLGSTREQAVHRLIQLERRFQKYPLHKLEYIKFMQEYISLGHMQRAENKADKSSLKLPVYLPHHFVLKEDSTTTKLRVVFDGSAKSSSGLSLNDTLLVGPKSQRDLYILIICFRLFIIGIIADIAKMYRQFLIHPDDRDYQRILWRESSSDPIQEYPLATVTYGTASASFLATRCLNKLAEEEKSVHTHAAKSLIENTYVDDLKGGANSEESAIHLVNDLISITAKGKMEMRKWWSNSPTVMEAIPEQLRGDSSLLTLDSEANTIKALGIQWEPATDSFRFEVKPSLSSVITKRYLLSEIAKTFDPVGWLSPVTINAKLLLQELWLQNYEWDQRVSEEMEKKWLSYQASIECIKSIRIPRCVIAEEVKKYELHGFCDSSEKAYASAVYLRVEQTNGVVIVNLLTSRTKVAPIKQISLPRLELCGASLLTETMSAVMQAFSFKYDLFYWTDSTIVLRWISSHSRRWKTFVANRVSAIQTAAPPELWRHVSSKDNPADLPSRGISPAELQDSSIWWKGPQWLSTNQYPNTTVVANTKEVENEEKTSQAKLVCNLATFGNTYNQLFGYFSTYKKLIKSAAIYRRFATYLRTKQVQKSPISTLELQQARIKLIIWIQQLEFISDIVLLTKGQSLLPKSKLCQLNPFIDKDGVLRVGGRLQFSQVPDNKKFPIILPRKHPFTKLLITHVHLTNLHSGFSQTHYTLRREYWIIGARDTIRDLIRRCVTCKKLNTTTAEQLMGSLPSGRVNINRAFLHSGVDFAGPYLVKMKTGRRVSPEKCYICIFVCLATKAIHLEAVTNLTSEAFLACFERFAARRGIPAHVYSDCGTNFVGADRQLKEMWKNATHEIQHQLPTRGAQWHFNPPAAPHQGGLWEAGVKSMKFHFKRVVGNNLLSFEQFLTLLCRIEACLNSRPLCSLSSNPLDLDVLTPGHFLIGDAITSIAEPNLTLLRQNRLTHWETVRQMTQNFWRRWTNEYLSSLQQRFKWTQKRANLEVGDIVVIKDELLPITKWKLGRHPGKDGLVRSVTLKTANSELIRPIAKLCPLISIKDSE